MKHQTFYLDRLKKIYPNREYVSVSIDLADYLGKKIIWITFYDGNRCERVGSYLEADDWLNDLEIKQTEKIEYQKNHEILFSRF